MMHYRNNYTNSIVHYYEKQHDYIITPVSEKDEKQILYDVHELYTCMKNACAAAT